MKASCLVRTSGFALAVFLAAAGLGSGKAVGAAPVVMARRVATLPHDPKAFTQGLLFHNGFFYESTGRYGESSVRRVDPATGRILSSRALPGKYFGEGLAIVSGRLFQLTWREGRVFVEDLTDLRQVGSFPLATEGWGGCGFDGQLVVSDGSDTLTFYDPATMERLGTINVTDDGDPVIRLNELEAVGRTIWANVWGETRIAVIDPASGRVQAWVDCSSLADPVTDTHPDNVLNGIAYDAATGRLWVTGKLWPAIYEITIPGLPTGISR